MGDRIASLKLTPPHRVDHQRFTSRRAAQVGPVPPIHHLHRTVGNRAISRLLPSPIIQPKLTVSDPKDQYEREADRVADQVMRMPESQSVATRSEDGASRVVQRKCSCDGAGADCAECKEKEVSTLQRTASNHVEPEHAPAIVHEVLRSPGQSLDASTRAFMEPRFNRDFSGVRVHTDNRAAQSARSVNALAFTVGRNIVFSAGQYNPKSPEGQRLVAHELTHVVQQGSGSGGTLRRYPKVGTPFKHPKGKVSTFKKIEATFDGQDFEVKGDGTSILKTAGQSGRPVAVRSADAKTCKGSTTESYLNNPRYVGIRDYGAIPEGEYHFVATSFATFSAAEQVRMITGGYFTDPFGATIHGGDWGAGRAPLTPTRLLPSGCGSTKKRSGFFLHGGSLTGSSGCIDIGNTGVSALLPLLEGFTKPILVRVRYTHPPPTVGKAGRVLGGFVYPGQENPSIEDRLKGAAEQLFGPGSED